MSQIVLDVEAGQVSAELARRGIPPHARVHVLVEVAPSGELSMAAIAQAGKGLDWLAEEPELYSDADLIEPARCVFPFGSTVLARCPFTDLSGDGLHRQRGYVGARDRDGTILLRAAACPIVSGMVVASKSSAPNTSRRAAEVGATYRGVRLQHTEAPSRFTPKRIKEAVDAAISKHADALAGRKKS